MNDIFEFTEKLYSVRINSPFWLEDATAKYGIKTKKYGMESFLSNKTVI